jgi:transposase
VAAPYRVGTDKVRGWIRRGELRAINTKDVRSGRPRWVIPPEAPADFERGRAPSTPPPRPKRRKRITRVDYYPD